MRSPMRSPMLDLKFDMINAWDRRRGEVVFDNGYTASVIEENWWRGIYSVAPINSRSNRIVYDTPVTPLGELPSVCGIRELDMVLCAIRDLPERID